MGNVIPPQFGVPLTADELNSSIPTSILYGVTPSNEFIPVQINSVGALSISGTISVGTVTIEGLDPVDSSTHPLAIVNFGPDGYALRTAIFDGGNQLIVNPDGSINVNADIIIGDTISVTQGTSPWVINGSVTANIGTTNGLALDSSLSTIDTDIKASQPRKLQDGSGNNITSQVNGSQRALDVGIDVAGVQVDPRAIRALTSSDVVTVDQGTSPWIVGHTDVAPSTQNITVKDTGSSTSTGTNGQVFITGTPTVNSIASFSVSSMETVTVQVTGTWTGTLQSEQSIDGGVTWVSTTLHQTGLEVVNIVAPILVSSFSANLIGSLNISGATNFRIRAIAAMTGTAIVKVVQSFNDHSISVSGAVNNTPPFSSLDFFGRNRISAPNSLFASQFLYDKEPLLWDELLVTSGTATLTAPTIALAVTTTSGSRVVRQTKEYFVYQPGRPEQAEFTVIFGTGTANCQQMLGVFDDNDGCFLRLNGTTFEAVIRSSMSGSPVDIATSQANFNVDKLDGTGPSGMVLDITKVQLFVIEYQWFGVGPVRFGLYYNGGIAYFHIVQHTNTFSTPYMKRGSLPLRYEIVNTGTTSGATTLTQICCCIQSEAGYEPTGIERTVDTGTTARAVSGTGSLPLLSIRLKSANNRATIVPETFSVITDAANNFRYQIILNGTLTGASFNSVSATSFAEFDIAATALTGGTIIASGYVATTIRQAVEDINSLLKLVSNIAGTSDIITLYVSNISSGVNYFGSLSWNEYA